MPRLTLNFSKITFKKREATTALENAVVRSVYAGITEFVFELIYLVPVDTGMALASAFGTVYNNGKRVSSLQWGLGEDEPMPEDMMSDSMFLKKIKSGGKPYHIGNTVAGFKSPKAGQQLGNYQVSGSLQNGFHVEFNSKVWHYDLNDMYKVSNHAGTPWNTVAKARIKFFVGYERRLKKELANFKLADYVHQVRGSLGSSENFYRTMPSGVRGSYMPAQEFRASRRLDNDLLGTLEKNYQLLVMRQALQHAHYNFQRHAKE